jgi:hypothetical protein
LLGALKLLKKHVTGALCESAFGKQRLDERQRRWSLTALVQFWMAVILRAPPSLSQALLDAQEGRDRLFPRIQASPQAFFDRCKNLSWRFFAQVFELLVARLLKREWAPESGYCRELAGLRKRFTEVLLIDGSRLAAVAHRLKILWNVRAVVLPGCILAVYDLYRGFARLLRFSADAAESEMNRAREAIGQIPRDSLLVGDRLYAAGVFFAELQQKGLWGLFRRNRTMKLGNRRRLSKRRIPGAGRLEEWWVQASTGSGDPDGQQTLRFIRMKRGHKVYELLTNVLDSDRLTAEEAMRVYPFRWSIERMFFHLKEVLNLNRFYPGNPNAIAMQLYAAAIVYAALRVAQAEVALNIGIQPERISPAKFFPKMAAACAAYTFAEEGVETVMQMNPGKRIRRPTFGGARFASVALKVILLEPRKGPRRKRRFCKGRTKWKSMARIPGGKWYGY